MVDIGHTDETLYWQRVRANLAAQKLRDYERGEITEEQSPLATMGGRLPDSKLSHVYAPTNDELAEHARAGGQIEHWVASRQKWSLIFDPLAFCALEGDVRNPGYRLVPPKEPTIEELHAQITKLQERVTYLEGNRGS